MAVLVSGADYSVAAVFSAFANRVTSRLRDCDPEIADLTGATLSARVRRMQRRMISRRERSEPEPCRHGREEAEASVARCPQTPPHPAKGKDLNEVIALLTQRDEPQHSCHSQLQVWSDNGGTIPSERRAFTPSSILFRPRRSRDSPCGIAAWVEAPGTAPGSEELITLPVYRHSQPSLADPNIGDPVPVEKSVKGGDINETAAAGA